MQLNTLQSATKRKDQKRIGRGGKRGTYSGRGIKGQKARAGHRIRPALRDLLKKIPKKRGYRFHSVHGRPVIVNLSTLDKHFAAGTTVSPETLRARGLFTIKDRAATPIKILGNGTVTKTLTIEKIAVSASAKAKIEAAGGKIIE
ncbi:MAG: 50S ribosomal protein L15 [bacterium]|nr:50S ribosomal protein L15 [bacterium]MDZ4295981.1 50S ribosomal protein L15 [Patescibacteria group bacterium]